MTRELEEKYDDLLRELKGFDSLAVAFSGGVDSTFLLKAAKEALGERAVAFTAVSDFFPQREKRESEKFCGREGIRHILCPVRELEIPGVSENPPNRCYLCKRALFEVFLARAAELGISAVAEGSNLDDLGDYRPGLAAIAELKIESPLRACGFTKEDIRKASAWLGLDTADKPSYACLASRFVYGESLTKEGLKRVDMAEQFLLDLGFRQMRVRVHGNAMARIEVLPEDISRLAEEGIRRKVAEKFRDIGFSYVALDLTGFRSGSMNEMLPRTDK